MKLFLVFAIFYGLFAVREQQGAKSDGKRKAFRWRSLR